MRAVEFLVHRFTPHMYDKKSLRWTMNQKLLEAFRRILDICR